MVGRLHIVILGAPGSGKGTQAARLARERNLRHLSTGDMLRDAVARRSELGAKAESFMKRGLLVPDDLILGLVETEIGSADTRGWILDGFPRTLAQAEALEKLLGARGEMIDKVIDIEVVPEVIVRRLSNRRVCPKCKAVYNLDTIRTKVPGKCDICGTDLVKRPDDEEATVRRRLQVYEEQTAPLIAFYEKQGRLVHVNGAGGIEETFAEIVRGLR